ncbi:hypothetical protein TSUD_310320 [Trifolium subterraneum]|uniref:Transmembrane protein n=1 Tax=Trifolium subterraneum TaxID=3900 RepID=A0A2Z6LVR4_TRISU|nr:hypothetical protein TSUD_310320 [Trifolium subterraneum]
MEWVSSKRRGPEWKQSWRGKSMASVSAPPFHLLMIFGIVVSLLCLSQYNHFKAQIHNTAVNFQFFLFFFPFLLMFFIISYSTGGRRLSFGSI